MVAYSLDQALQDIAALRQDIANMKQNLTIGSSLTLPDGSVWTSGLAMGGSQITGEDPTPVPVGGFTSGWSNRGTGFPILQVQRMAIAPGMMYVVGEVLTSVTGYSNPCVAGTVGSSYQPATEQPLNVRIFQGTPTVPPAVGFLRCVLTTAGVIQINGVSSSGQTGFQIWGIVSLTA